MNGLKMHNLSLPTELPLVLKVMKLSPEMCITMLLAAASTNGQRFKSTFDRFTSFASTAKLTHTNQIWKYLSSTRSFYS